jgi:hypothetical protein
MLRLVMTGQRIKITKKNYNHVRSGVEYLVHTFQINAEKWTVELFDKIPVKSTQKSRAELEDWLVTYLSDPVLKNINTIIKKGGLAGTRTVILSTNTVESLEEYGYKHGIKSAESIIRILLESEKTPNLHDA